MKNLTVIKYVGITVTVTIYKDSIHFWIANLRSEFQRFTFISETENFAEMEVIDGHQSFSFEPMHPSRLKAEGLVHQKPRFGEDKNIYAVPSLGAAYLFLRVKGGEKLMLNITEGFGYSNSVAIEIHQGAVKALNLPDNGRVWQSPMLEF